ncbi:hypothetical protein ACQJBY_066362 [Aegilops geniculata]
MDEEDENRGGGGRRQSGRWDPVEDVVWSSEDSEDQPGLTSRLSVKHVVEVIQKFDDYKRWLVSEIGFEGVLKLPLLQKIDLKMSVWAMKKVDVKSRAICIDKNRTILFRAEDFHKNFGVPCGNRAVRGRDGEIKSAGIEFIKQTIGMNGSPAYNLKVAEDFLNRDISEESSKIEKDCFQISLVIFVMGYLVSPGEKHEYKMIDFWGAVANPELISQFNWCEYALDDLMAAVIRMKEEYENKAQTVHLFGCHLFFQVFLLDNIDLGIFNMPHSVFPRIQCFEQKKLREMILMARCDQRGVITYVPGAVRPPDSVCYTRAVACSPKSRVDTSIPSSSKQGVFSSFVTPSRGGSTSGVNVNRGPLKFLSDPISANRSIGPSDFSKHLRQICKDDPVLEEMSLMLKQHNAKCTLSTTLLRNQLQYDMFCFAEKMVEFVKERCRCCSKRGLSKCIKLCESGEDRAARTGVFEVGRRLEMSDDEGDSKADEEDNQQRIKRRRDVRNETTGGAGPSEMVDDVPVYNNPVVERQPVGRDEFFSDRIVAYAQNIADMVQSLYENDSEEGNAVYFSSTEPKLPRRRYVTSASFCGDPWSRGCLPQPPPISLTSKFNSWLAGENDFLLDSVWLVHTTPRFVRVNAVCVQQQLLGMHDLDHEVATLVLRRFHQLDSGVEGVSPYMMWREVLEPDFSTHVLAGEKVVHIKAVQSQLARAKHDITASRMFYVPLILDQGWAAYMWDMMRKEIHVLDPMCCQVEGAEQRSMMHQEAMTQIHTALFSCLNEFFAKWHCTSERWKRKFPRITDDVFNSRIESGICMIHAIRQYDGEKMKWPLTKVVIDVSFTEHPVYFSHLIYPAA